MSKILFSVIFTVCLCITGSQLFFESMDLPYTPDPKAVHCINETMPQLRDCDDKARSDWKDANHTQSHCCSQWESIVCGHTYIMDKCNKTEIDALDVWLFEFIAEETKDNCKDYLFGSEECHKKQ